MALFRLFGGKEDPQPTQPESDARTGAAPGAAIMFDPALVSKLTHDHRQLPDIFKQVQAALARNIGAALVKRIEREERALYPPYLPTYRSDPVG